MAARSAQEAEKQTTTAMMEGIFRSPEPPRIVAYILTLAGAMGLLFWGLSDIPMALLRGLVFFALPVVAASLVTKPLAETLGGRMYLRRSTLLGLIGEIMVFLYLTVGTLLNRLLALPADREMPYRFLIMGWASSLWLRQTILLATSHSNPIRSLPAAVAQPAFGLALLIPLGPMGTFTQGDIILTAVSLVAFGLLGAAFTLASVKPLTQAFGVDGLAMLRHSLDHWTEHGEEGREEMEAFFDAWGSTTDAHVGVVAFRTRAGPKTLLVVPSIHPGPFGQLGGSNLPEKLQRRLGDLAPNVIVAHGPSTHDDNLTRTAECDKVAAAVAEALRGATFTREASPMTRVRREAANVLAQALGPSVLVVASQAPRPTDDLDQATGHAMMAAARGAGAEVAICVDAHNSLELGSGMVHFGSTESADLVEASGEATGKALKASILGLRVGYARRDDLANPVCGLGPAGIQVLVLEARGVRGAYVVYDANNMEPGLREEILGGLKDLVGEAEVMTTDNHIVNAWIPGFNPLGPRWPHAELVEATRGVVAAAVEDLEEGEAAVASAWARGVRVWGHHSAIRMTSTIQAIMTNLRFNAVVSLALAVAVAGLAFVAIG